MAIGLPDYSRGIRPGYGSGQNKAGYKVVLKNDTTPLATISGKGMIYGGYVRVEYTSSLSDSGLFLYVDDEKLGSIGFETLDRWNLDVEHSYPVYKRKYDDTNFIYVVAFSHGITFEKNIRIEYIEAGGKTPTAWWQIIYALI